MKCPKCSYIGFEATDRCRNCGYEFALAARDAEAVPLPVRSPATSDGPLADLDLVSIPSGSERRRPGVLHELDLDRIIGAPEAEPDLPLFEGAGTHTDPAAASLRVVEAGRPVAAPATPRRPLSVRRPTPAPSKLRGDTPPTHRPVRNLELPLPVDTPVVRAQGRPEGEAAVSADAMSRAGAALTDAGLLLAIDAMVVYFTLRLMSLSLRDVGALPLLPLVAFLALLNGGYLLAFTAATGQTIGKMAFGLKVVGVDRAVTPLTAAVRSAGCFVSALTLGAGLVPALLGGRALHDKLAGTTVVHAGE